MSRRIFRVRTPNEPSAVIATNTLRCTVPCTTAALASAPTGWSCPAQHAGAPVSGRSRRRLVTSLRVVAASKLLAAIFTRAGKCLDRNSSSSRCRAVELPCYARVRRRRQSGRSPGSRNARPRIRRGGAASDRPPRSRVTGRAVCHCSASPVTRRRRSAPRGLRRAGVR
jgi:hypothetical protein